MSQPHHTTQLSSAELAQQLLGIGIIGLLDGDFPSDEILEIGDALLASPVLAVVVTYSGPRSLQAISILRERGAEHMLVGATNICTAMDANLAVNAGAQFLISPYFDHATSACAHALRTLYIPGVFIHSEAEEALEAGHNMLHLFPADILGTSHLLDLRTSLPECTFIPSSGIHLHNIVAHAKAGAGALIVDCGPQQGEVWTQAQIITYVRSLRRVWEQTRLEGVETGESSRGVNPLSPHLAS
jgi:2-dehydro-3-deoxyphosphogluconate aldolase/(4S)-4-hydroxy-2-oxoglutarate aldolase